MPSGIYAIVNIYNDKIYVGSAVRLQYRWKNHRIALQYNKHTNRYLQSAYNDHFLSNPFIYTVLKYCAVDVLIQREQFYIDLLKSANREFGYNLSPTAGNCIGVKHTDETKIEWSKQRKNKPRSEEAKAAIKAGWEKRRAAGPVSEETKRRLSESHKGQSRSEEFKTAMSKRLIGNTFNTGRVQSLTQVLDRAAKLTGQKRTPEQIFNIAEGKRLAARRREKDLMWTW